MKYTLPQATLMALRKLYTKFAGEERFDLSKVTANYQMASDIIAAHIDSGTPFMLSRFGAVEIGAVATYVGMLSPHKPFDYVQNKAPQWWWNEGTRFCMKNNAGFFPNDDEHLEEFAKLMLESAPLIDILVSWQVQEKYLQAYLSPDSKVSYDAVDPYFAEHPWTAHLRGKRVLVVHPFDAEIRQQYEQNRTKLFDNPEILPEFGLITYKAVQSIGGSEEYATWFDALEKMKADISQLDFDIALLGCGAYGMPLAAHIKRMGKQAIHIGGSLQLLFGIRGKRWEDPNYGSLVLKQKGRYTNLPNEYWIRPYESSRTKNYKQVDQGSYW